MFRLLIALFLIMPFFGHTKDKVAFLFLTVYDVNQAELWKEEFRNDPRFSIYVHSKKKMNSTFFSKHRIKKIVSTSWAIHVKAWQELFKEAVKDPNNKKFVLVSDSCLPLRPLGEIYDYLINNDNTYMTFTKPFWPKNHGREVVELPLENRWVGSEWVILNRKHALLVAKDKDVIKVVSKHGSDAESYFPSLLSYNKMLFDKDIVQIETTYTNWELGRDSHPYTFEKDSPEYILMLKNARKAGFLFARKISKSFPSTKLRAIINND